MARHHRLDTELVRRGLVASRAEARQAIESGIVTVNGVPVERAAALVAPETPVALLRRPRRFASRGGDKLDRALARLEVDVEGRRWLDAGASTGGFTDCLLQRGASSVVAVDVGYGQLDWRLRNDERVTVLERTNIRELTPADLPWTPEAVVADLSFISLRVVMPVLVDLATPQADFVVLVKPQFEVGREHVGKGGVVRDPALWAASMRSVVDGAARLGLGVRGAVASELPGPAGNREFFVALRAGDDVPGDHIGGAIAEAGGG